MSSRGKVSELPIDGLNKFNPATIRPDSTCVFIGKRNTGKSTLVEDILFHLRSQIPTAVVFSRTERVNPFYVRFIPDSMIYDELDMDALKRAMSRQLVVVRNPPPIENFNPTLLIIMDDCMPEKKAFNDSLIREIFFNGRHRKVFLMLNIQYPNDLPKALRGNIDYMFLLREDNQQNRKIFWELSGCFDSFKEFNAVFQRYTDKYGCLVVNKVTKSNEIKDRLYWYCAEPDHGEWKLDAGDMFVFDAQHYTGNMDLSVTYDWNSGLNPIERVTASVATSGPSGKGKRSGGSSKDSSIVLHKYDENGMMIEE